MNDLVQDLSKLTTIPETALKELIEKSLLCIAHSVFETSSFHDEHITQIDIGIGMLYIYVVDDYIKYKFIPSKRMETLLVNTLSQSKSPLIQEVENALADRIVKTSKTMF